MSIGKNIKKLREENKLTQKELAEIAGVTDKAVSMWEQEKRDPRMGAMQRMADYFSIRISDLLSGVKENFGSLNTLYVPIVKQIALVNNVSSREICGYGVVDEKEVAEGKEYLFYKIVDDRMSPVFVKNDLILIQLKNRIESGKYGVVSVNGGNSFIARVMIDDKGIELVSENSAYGKLCFDVKGMKSIKILGEIKKVIRNV